jgi:alkylation response protein AidB-like acyl-CoA dehydrogenase
MLDSEGRDGIAKLGAVKTLIARTEAWRLLLEKLYDIASHSALRLCPRLRVQDASAGYIPHSAMEFDLLCSSLAALAFGPEPGAMGYDAGQVFGGFAYSEDDPNSRFYRTAPLPLPDSRMALPPN